MTPQEALNTPTLSANSLQDIIENYPDASWSPFPWPWLILVLAVLVIAGGIYAIFRFRRRPKHKVVEKTPQERLEEAIGTLQRIGLDDVRAFYTQARLVINAYLRILWNKEVDALTSEELSHLISQAPSTLVASDSLLTLIRHYEEALFAANSVSVEERKREFDLLQNLSS